jgi:hypothetical protein
MRCFGAGARSVRRRRSVCNSEEYLCCEFSLVKIAVAREEKVTCTLPFTIHHRFFRDMSSSISIVYMAIRLSGKIRVLLARARHHRRAAGTFLPLVSRLALPLPDGSKGSIGTRGGSSLMVLVLVTSLVAVAASAAECTCPSRPIWRLCEGWGRRRIRRHSLMLILSYRFMSLLSLR